MSRHYWRSKKRSSEVCLELVQLLIKGLTIFCSGDFTQFHSVPGPYELKRNCLNIFLFLALVAILFSRAEMVEQLVEELPKSYPIRFGRNPPGGNIDVV